MMDTSVLLTSISPNVHNSPYNYINTLQVQLVVLEALEVALEQFQDTDRYMVVRLTRYSLVNLHL